MSSYTKTYSCFFEIELAEQEFGLSREEHNYLCNKRLLVLIATLTHAGIRFYPEQSNDDLIRTILQNKHKSPSNFVWEHCSSSTAGGRMGVMRLVPKNQHHPRSTFWRRIHPDYKNRGGYHEWAKAAGAPAILLKNDAQQLHHIDLMESPRAPAALLFSFLKNAVLTNNLLSTHKVLYRMNELGLSSKEISQLIQQSFTVGAQKRETTLLHEAVKNGYEPLFKALFYYIDPHLPNPIDSDGNSLSHIAALYNRPGLLKILLFSEKNTNTINKQQQGIYDILVIKKFKQSLSVYEGFQVKSGCGLLHNSRNKKTPTLDFFSNQPKKINQQVSLFKQGFYHKTVPVKKWTFSQTLRGITTCLKNIGK